MRRPITQMLALLALIALLVLTGWTTFAGSQEDSYELTWYTMEPGTVYNDDGTPFTLSATAGQPDASHSDLPDHSLQGGFWTVVHSLSILGHEIFLPLITTAQ